MTTEELLQKCINRDQTAWDEFIRRYRGTVTKSVRYKLNKLNQHVQRNEALDIVQEIFLSIWEKDKLQKVKNPLYLKSWLVIVSLNFTLNYCQKNIFKTGKSMLSLDEGAFSEDVGTTLKEIIPSSKLNAIKMIDLNELKHIVEKGISELDYKQQLALKLNIYDGKKQKDIAGIMNMPIGTVSTLISRGKKHLQKKLKKFV